MSFKPSAGRVPFGGGVPPGRVGSPGAIVPVVGPMGWSVRDAELVMRTICTKDAWTFDESVMNVPWRRVEPATRPLRFGLIRGHAKRPLHPPMARALHSAATKLKEKGHQVVLLDDKIPDLWESAILAYKFFMLDPKKTPFTILKAGGEPPVPSLKTASFKELEAWGPSLDELWDMNVERSKIVRSYHDLLVEHELDAVLMPGYQATAVPHDTYGVTIYTVLENLLNVGALLTALLHELTHCSIRPEFYRFKKRTKS
jgi:amidase